MEIGIFAKTFPGTDPATVLTAARAAGFTTVQYNLACSGLPSMPDAVPAGTGAAVAEAARANGLTIAALSGTYNMIHPDPARRAEGLRRLDLVAGAAKDMGTRLVTLCTGTRDPDDQWRAHPDNDTPEAWADLLVEMEQAIAIAERHDIMLGIEPERANVVSSAHHARRLVDTLASDRLGIVIDAANLVETEPAPAREAIIAEAIALLSDRIVMAHAKDRTADGGFAAAGAGMLDFSKYLGLLVEAGFDGPVIAHGLEPVEAPGVAAFLRRTIAGFAR